MSEFKGTPGPWSRDEYEFFNSDGANIFDLTYGSHTGIKEDEANTKLIAAAPELLGALELILSYHDDGNCVLHQDDVSMARAAIAKALGG